MPVVVFYMFFTSQEINTKRSPDTTKLFVDFFGPEDIQWANKVLEGSSKGSTTPEGMPGGLGTPRWVVPTSMASRTAFLLYKYHNIPKTLGSRRKSILAAASSRNTRSNLDTVTEGFIMLIGATPMMRE